MTKPDIFAFGRPEWRIIEYTRDGIVYRQNQSIIFGFYTDMSDPYRDGQSYGYKTRFQNEEELVADLNEDARNYKPKGPKRNKRVVNVGS